MIVVDASVLIEVLLRTFRARECEQRLFSDTWNLCAPCLLDVEIAQVLRRYALNAELSSERGAEALSDLRDFPITRYEHEPFLTRIWELRHSLSAYDAAYVSLAEALEAPLLTCDARIANAHGHRAKVELVV